MNSYKSFTLALEKAADLAKRDIKEIELIAVSKKKPVQNIIEVIRQNHVSFGENQIQEIETKWPDLKMKFPNLSLNFIGSIQSRKVEAIHEHCDVIHSIDRLKIIKLFSNLESSTGIKRKYFIQINTGNESQKSGVLFQDAEKFISDCIGNYKLNFVGLMCLPPINEDPKVHFIKLRDLAKNFHLPYLSMGMSGDYETAIACGATHIRIGTHIFGERN
jgi:pyridoxal phosphate enzyme (YggS family)|tara:strand:- start:310 stop:963 length:654 start_codon:yes stop_codon:yes gene_type:complete